MTADLLPWLFLFLCVICVSHTTIDGKNGFTPSDTSCHGSFLKFLSLFFIINLVPC